MLLVPDTEADREVLLLARGLFEAELQAVAVPLTVAHLEPSPLTLRDALVDNEFTRLLVVTETLTHRLAEADSTGEIDGLEELEGDGDVDVDIVTEGDEEAAVDTLLEKSGDTDRKALPDLDVVCVFEFVVVADGGDDAEFETDIVREPATDAETVFVRDAVADPLKTPLNDELIDGLDVPVMDGLPEDVVDAL